MRRCRSLGEDRPLGPEVDRLDRTILATGTLLARTRAAAAPAPVWVSALELTYLDGAAVEALALTDEEILGAVRSVLGAQGRDETVIEPRTHLFPRGATGHFNVLRGATPRFAGVKVVGDFVENHRLGLPSELALLLLMDPMTGVPQAILDATAITEMRTGAVTALGAEALARRSGPGARTHRGARDRVLERAPVLPRAARAGGDPRALAPAREPRGVRRAPARGPRAPGGRLRRTGSRRSAAPTSSSRPAG